MFEPVSVVVASFLAAHPRVADLVRHYTVEGIKEVVRNYERAAASKRTVYITRFGLKEYHRVGCERLRRCSLLTLSQREALALGYRSCSRCSP